MRHYYEEKECDCLINKVLAQVESAMVGDATVTVNFPSSPCESLSSQSEVDGFKSMPSVFTSQAPAGGRRPGSRSRRTLADSQLFLVKDDFIISFFFRILFFQMSNLSPENKDLCFYFGV